MSERNPRPITTWINSLLIFEFPIKFLREAADLVDIRKGLCVSFGHGWRAQDQAAHGERSWSQFHLSYESWKKNMGITRISNLFAANVDAVPAANPSKAITPQSSPANGPSDAVVVSRSLQSANRVPLQDAEAARAAKVDQLKQQVKSGTYKPNKEQVAVSILRDLA
jgi:flagellar biosynthesis anti-sigma factor FlgM